MYVNLDTYRNLLAVTEAAGATLVAVSKTKPVAAIQELYDLGHRDFGENYVQELVDKQAVLPPDIRWHFIGHLQTNKVKYIAPFVYLIHGVDSGKLLKEINKQASKCGRTINVLLQMHIAKEETKFGLDEAGLEGLLDAYAGETAPLQNVIINGYMGMASFSDDASVIREEFQRLRKMFDDHAHRQTENYKPKTLSMGMSGDYGIALEEGSNLIRIGSLLFGARP